MCVAPPAHVGAWSMAVLLGQPFEYYYYYYCGLAYLAQFLADLPQLHLYNYTIHVASAEYCVY